MSRLKGAPRGRAPLAAAILAVAALAAAAASAGDPTPAPKPDVGEEPSPKELFESYCSACHRLKLAESQRLDRANWEWVIDDMIEKYNASWITPEEKAVLLDYLVKHHGPGS